MLNVLFIWGFNFNNTFEQQREKIFLIKNFKWKYSVGDFAYFTSEENAWLDLLASEKGLSLKPTDKLVN